MRIIMKRCLHRWWSLTAPYPVGLKAMKNLMYALGCLIAVLAITLPFIWGCGFQTAYPPSMESTDKLVRQVRETLKTESRLDLSTVTIERKLLEDMVEITLLSRKEYRRASQDNAVYSIVLIISGISLALVLFPRKIQRRSDPNLSAHETR